MKNILKYDFGIIYLFNERTLASSKISKMLFILITTIQNLMAFMFSVYVCNFNWKEIRAIANSINYAILYILFHFNIVPIHNLASNHFILIDCAIFVIWWIFFWYLCMLQYNIFFQLKITNEQSQKKKNCKYFLSCHEVPKWTKLWFVLGKFFH